METFILTSASSPEGDVQNNSGSMESLKKILTNPVLYIVIGILLLLIIIVYLIRRFVKAKPNASTIIVRKGRIYKVLDESNPNHFLMPFLDSVGAIITNDEKEFSSDRLYINNGPDSLYKINYTLKYRVINPKEFYKYLNDFQILLPDKLNDELRLFADQGNALVLVKDYRENTKKILEVINKAVKDYFVEVTEFKINIIEPIGRK